MKELLDAVPRVPYQEARRLLLLDTCFLIDAAARHRLFELESAGVAMTSFNLAELLHVEHRLETHVRHALREFLKRRDGLVMVEVPVVPGDREAERAFVASVEPVLLREVPDASDAVLIATAIATMSNVLTKDRHHLYTAVLENHLRHVGINVWKEWKDAGS